MRYITDRKIDAIKMDGGWRFRWDDVARFVASHTQGSVRLQVGILKIAGGVAELADAADLNPRLGLVMQKQKWR